MHASLLSLREELESLSKAILGASAEKRLVYEFTNPWGAPLTPNDFSNMALGLVSIIDNFETDEISEDFEEFIKGASRKLQHFKNVQLQHLFNGNTQVVMPAFLALIQSIQSHLNEIVGWSRISDTDKLPHEIARRIRAVNALLDEVAPQSKELKERIRLINDAHGAAESLPTDMQQLAESRKRIGAIEKEVEKMSANIEHLKMQTEMNYSASDARAKDAIRVAGQCEEAYRIATTKGLAGAFELKAKGLERTVYYWIFGLMAALAGGGWVSYLRFSSIIPNIGSGPIGNDVFWVNTIGGIISMGAAVWFAWLAAKQIGQRFRLAEDYAFKASVAKAYEGYRKESIHLDSDNEEFQRRLFSSALDRLDEAPLRLIESESHGGPIYELLNSEAVIRLIEKSPELLSVANKVKFLKKKITNTTKTTAQLHGESKPA